MIVGDLLAPNGNVNLSGEGGTQGKQRHEGMRGTVTARHTVTTFVTHYVTARESPSHYMSALDPIQFPLTRVSGLSRGSETVNLQL